MSDHGSLTASFRVVPAAADVDSVRVAAGLTGAEAGKVGARRDEVGSKDWGGGDDGHYGLR